MYVVVSIVILVVSFNICNIYLEKKLTFWICKSNLQIKPFSKRSPSKGIEN